MMAPMPNDEHQQLVSRFVSIFEEAIGWPGLGHVRPGVNVSDRKEDWKLNYRVPDVAVFLHGGEAENHDAFWYGGPDFVVEIISPDDRTMDKIPFYSTVNAQELLLVDRDPWSIQLYQLNGGQLMPSGASGLDMSVVLSSRVLPFTFRLAAGQTRPQIEVTHTKSGKIWLV